ncbi:MAG: hypothetical protein VX464_14395 [Pseudomonadota bacterium]|nr:hypothetical protein [Pseudomonadota bacterium]
MTYRSIRSFLHLAVLALFVALTASCYLPNKFELTMQVAPDGRYAVAYDGTLTQLLFLQRIGSGELQGHAIDEYVGIYENEMRRNSGFKEVTYLGNAEYQVKYEKQGSLAKEKQYSFPTRRGIVLGLRRWTAESAQDYIARFEATGHPALQSLAEAGFANEPHIMELFGDRLPAKMRQDLIANGFWIQGEIRIWTAAKVGYHNANRVVEGNPSLYIWSIDDLNQPSPHMILAWTPPSAD